MTSVVARQDVFHAGLHWSARLLSLLSIGLLALFVFGDEGNLSQATTNEAIGLTLFPLGVVVGMLLSWKYETAGAVVSIASLAGFYLWHVVTVDGLPGGPYFLLFTLPAFLFLADGLWGSSRSEVRRSKG